jgi:hypothetical protein
LPKSIIIHLGDPREVLMVLARKVKRQGGSRSRDLFIFSKPGGEQPGSLQGG